MLEPVSVGDWRNLEFDSRFDTRKDQRKGL